MFQVWGGFENLWHSKVQNEGYIGLGLPVDGQGESHGLIGTTAIPHSFKVY
jgi:hypothetical protein